MNINGRDIIQFHKPSNLRSSEECWGVAKRKGKPIRKKLLVIGTGRCGTMFTTKALSTVGIDMKHEVVGADGTVSHYFVVDSKWYPMAPWQANAGKKHVGERRSDYAFDNIFHIVRNPLKTIPSMTRIFGSVTWYFYEQNGLIPTGLKSSMHKAMYLWLSHNAAAESQADITFQLEQYEQAWPKLMKLLKHDAPYPAHLKPMNKTSGFRQYTPATYDQLASVDRSLAADIRKLAAKYKYEV